MGMTLAVVWSVSINGEKLPIARKRHINSIQIKNNCNGSDIATITIYDKNMEYIEDNIYVEDVAVSITMSFVGAEGTVKFDGYISAIDIDFPEEGIPVITLTCFDKSHVMNRLKKKRSWKKKTRLQVAQIIAQEYGFKFEGDPDYAGEEKDTISQSSQTDIEFLENLASQEKPELYLCKLIGDTIVYKRRGLLTAPSVELHYRESPWDIRSFKPQINKETMEEESSSSDISTDTKKTDTAISSGTGNSQGSAVEGSAGTPKPSVNINTTNGYGSYDVVKETTPTSGYDFRGIPMQASPDRKRLSV